ALGEPSCQAGGSAVVVPTFAFRNGDANFDFDLTDRYARFVLSAQLDVEWTLAAATSFSCEISLIDRPLGWLGPLELSGSTSLVFSVSAAVQAATLNSTVPIVA